MNELSQAGGGPAQVDDANKPRPTPLDLEPPHRFETRQETEELEQARTALGSLSWLAKQSRPALSFDVSRLLADVTKGSR